jgi:anti-anti-sigma factor
MTPGQDVEIITQRQAGDAAEVMIRGRLDGYWAGHLAAELDRFVRGGAHRLWLNLAEVTYLSSMGVGVLMRFHKQLKALGGGLKVVTPSESVTEVLEVSRLTNILVGAPRESGGRQEATWEIRPLRRGVIQETARATFETFEYSSAGPLRCRTTGEPTLLPDCRFREEDCPAVSLPADAFAVGIGALGGDFEDCQSRFGEFMAAAGMAAYFPTDGTNVPDYLMLGESTAAKVRLCYGVLYEGSFSRQIRFETSKDAGPLTLTELAANCLELSGTSAVGMVLIAESAGLMGAALRRSPVGEGSAPFAYPQIREWLTFTGERAYRSSTTLVVGVATRGAAGSLAPFVRPLGRGPEPAGHFHAAPFSHQVLPVGELDLKQTVAALFENQHLQGVLHLLGDYRDPAGLGESEFVRGACWIGPLSMATTGKYLA